MVSHAFGAEPLGRIWKKSSGRPLDGLWGPPGGLRGASGRLLGCLLGALGGLGRSPEHYHKTMVFTEVAGTLDAQMGVRCLSDVCQMGVRPAEVIRKVGPS